MIFKYKDKEFTKWSEIIEFVLNLDSSEQQKVVDEFSKIGPYALENIGYISGYYDDKTAKKIKQIFRTAHPIFDDPKNKGKSAFEIGLEMGKKSNV